MTTEIRHKLDKIADAMRSGGLGDPISYIEQFSYLLYLKLLDEAENGSTQAELLGIALDRATLFPAQAQRYRWSEWHLKLGFELLDFVGGEVFPYMASLVREAPSIAAFFADARFLFKDPHIFEEAVSILDTFEFAKLSPDVRGEIFEYLLFKLQSQVRSDFGHFRTPRELCDLMVQIVDPSIDDTIYDPACGTGGFLVEALEHVIAKHPPASPHIPIRGEDWEPLEKPDLGKLEASLFGHDISGEMVRVTLMNLVLHGAPRARIRRANALSEIGGLTENDKSRKYNIILSNPPISTLSSRDLIRPDLSTASNKSELLFLSLTMDALEKGGQCAVVVPESLLSGSSSSHVDLRKKLATEFELHAVISLPPAVFKPYAGIRASVIVFSKPLDTSSAKRDLDRFRGGDFVWFYQIKTDISISDELYSGGSVPLTSEGEVPALLRAWDLYKSSDFRNPPGPAARSLLPPDSDEPSYWWAKLEQISSSGFNLSPNAYKPQVERLAGAEEISPLIERSIEDQKRRITTLEVIGRRHSEYSGSYSGSSPHALVKLGEVAQLVGGGTPRRDKPEFWGGHIPWLTPTLLSPPATTIDKVDTGMLEGITEAGLAGSSASLLPSQTVIYSTRATIGKIAINGEPVATNQGFTNFICRREIIHPRYLAYFLLHATPEISQLGSGLTFREISKSALRDFEIRVPSSISEQLAIIELLDHADSVRQKKFPVGEPLTTEGSTATLEALFRTLLHQAFDGSLTAKWREGHLKESLQEMERQNS